MATIFQTKYEPMIKAIEVPNRQKFSKMIQDQIESYVGTRHEIKTSGSSK